MVWSQLDITKPHVAYGCIGVFSLLFSLVSLFVKEQLYIGESMLAGIFGIIVGPNCLNWFDPLSWGNSDSITLEISRILLCLQVFAVSVELPRKYMLKHWLSVTMLLVPVMTSGWLIIALFVWILIPGLNFPASLLMGACITATDPVLAQSVVSGTFAQKVPSHLRDLLSCESGCNDGLAFPFIFLSLDLLVYPGKGGKIVKDWICVTILWECLFGSFLGVVIGFSGRKAIRFAESKRIIDRESFLAFYLILALICAGFGSMLGVDDLLVSFFAGTAFAWDGWFAAKTHESNVSNVIDVLLNYAYFVYLGSIIPWADFNNSKIGLDVWRLIVLALVVIFLRRIPAVLSLKPLIPEVKSWRESMFLGHFGPIGVGAVFACLTAKGQLEAHAHTTTGNITNKNFKHWQALACLWPITCFSIVTSIIVHGSSVAVIVLGGHLSTVTLTATHASHTTEEANNIDGGLKTQLPLNNKTDSSSLQRMDFVSGPPVSQRNRRSTGALAMVQRRMRKRWKPKLRKKRASIQAFELGAIGKGRERCGGEAGAASVLPNIGGTCSTQNERRGIEINTMDCTETVNIFCNPDKISEDMENAKLDLVQDLEISEITSAKSTDENSPSEAEEHHSPNTGMVEYQGRNTNNKLTE